MDGVDVLARGDALAVCFRAQTVQQSGGGARNAPRVVVRSLRVSSRPRENRFSRRRAPFVCATIDDVTRLRTQLGEFAVDRRDRRFVCEFGFLRFARAYDARDARAGARGELTGSNRTGDEFLPRALEERNAFANDSSRDGFRGALVFSHLGVHLATERVRVLERQVH